MHEKRLLFTHGENYKSDEVKNLHVIPTNESIYKRFSTVKSGDIAVIKGYLIDWRETGESSYTKMKTALDFATISDKKAEVLLLVLYAVFYDRIYANEHLFK